MESERDKNNFLIFITQTTLSPQNYPTRNEDCLIEDLQLAIRNRRFLSAD